MRHRLVQALALGLVLAGCGNSSEERVKLAELQKAADQKVAKAERTAKEGIDRAQQEIDRLKGELAATAAKLEDATKTAAGATDGKKEVEAALGKARKAYKALGKLELDVLNKDVKELRAKLAKAPAKAKEAANKALEPLAAQQKAIAKDLAELDAATLATLDTIKAKLDKDLAQARATVRSARARVP